MWTWFQSVTACLPVWFIYCSLESKATGPPPTTPPVELMDAYSLNGTVPVEYYYVDDSLGGKDKLMKEVYLRKAFYSFHCTPRALDCTHIKYSYNEIQEIIDQVNVMRTEVLRSPVPSPPKQVSFSVWLTQLRDMWLIHALEEYPVRGKSVVVFGSTTPFYEAIALNHGATHVSVIEYNRLTYSHPLISTHAVSDIDSFNERFDVAFSISSFDHDGLGRYGDPLNPNGDIEAMNTVRTLLKPEGILYLTVPIGPDLLIWNLHRRYGKIRLPLLLQEWRQLAVYGMDEDLMHTYAPIATQYEPVFILKSKH